MTNANSIENRTSRRAVPLVASKRKHSCSKVYLEHNIFQKIFTRFSPKVISKGRRHPARPRSRLRLHRQGVRQRLY